MSVKITVKEVSIDDAKLILAKNDAMNEDNKLAAIHAEIAKMIARDKGCKMAARYLKIKGYSVGQARGMLL